MRTATKTNKMKLLIMIFLLSVVLMDANGKLLLLHLWAYVPIYLFIYLLYGPRQANLVLIAYASSEGSGEPAHPRSLARTSAVRS